MTRTGLHKFQAELKELEAKVPPLKKAIVTAREHGDLSENAEYHAAKEALAHVESKIRQIQTKIASAVIIDESRMPDGIVTFGSTVALLDCDSDEEETFTLVGAGEENFLEGKILTTSPLGQALLQKKEGEKFDFKVPNGTVIKYKVVKIERT
jgi:transcription elongation factor GreA